MYRYALLAGTLVCMTACSDITTPDVTAFDQAQLTEIPTTLPFAGSCQTSFTFIGPTTIEIVSVCQFRGIGRVTGLAQQTLDFSQIGQTGLIGISNTGVYTAPNGDQLFATFVGTGTQAGTTVSFSGTETYTGGTGRFAKTSGTAQSSGGADVVTATGYFTSTGTLTH